MRYPCLVREQICKTDIHVKLVKEELSPYGEPVIAVEKDLKCNYQDSAKTVMTPEKKLVQLSGVALFSGDICPELPVISGGTGTVFGAEREIMQGRKARNPDGSVNYTELRLI